MIQLKKEYSKKKKPKNGVKKHRDRQKEKW
jgi:hypothetical protein